MSLKKKINLVWIKRDIRTWDHEPFQAAENESFPYIPVFIFEPSVMNHPDCSMRHLQFQYLSILQSNEKLKNFNKSIEIFHAEAIDVFKYLMELFDIQKVFSYQESGIQLTFDRDLFLKKYFKANKIQWIEFQRDGIIRGIKNRENWDKNWYKVMHQPIVQNRFNLQDEKLNLNHSMTLSKELKAELKNYNHELQPPGEIFANKYLKSFLENRGFSYSKHISKPFDSRTSCSRLSPYLAWGNMSIRMVYQSVNLKLKVTQPKGPFKNFLSRIHWHCHFIQKFEQECRYETECINRGYENTAWVENESHLLAWKTGQTGVPLVDALMRCLHQTGWINFRMRALLVSFLTHHLFIDWRKGTYHLAQLFLDYEPGIHYTQFQMQAGTTGVNTIRTYNPVKNSIEHDTEAIFIKKWIPELSHLPVAFIHEPWKMTDMDCLMYQYERGITYPEPIVNPTEINPEYKMALWGARKSDMVKSEGKRIVLTHTRNTKKPSNKK